MPKKKSDGLYHVDIRPSGRDGRRYRKPFKTSGEALAYEKYIIANFKDAQPWAKPAKDNRNLTDLVELWYKLHGKQLKGGKARKSYLDNIAGIMHNPRAATITAKTFSSFRVDRLTDVSANTVNHDLAYLKALFNELARLGEWHKPNPFGNIRRIKTDETELSYLEEDQITELLAALDKCKNSHARITARVCLATGARWGEAATLKASQIKNGKITFAKTKNGKVRAIPVSAKIEKLVKDNAPLKDGYSTLKRTINKMKLKLPAGQLSHVLRHTFASHFMTNGGNIITLQRVLGHGSITMTMRYAHLSPEHLSEVLTLNPLK